MEEVKINIDDISAITQLPVAEIKRMVGDCPFDLSMAQAQEMLMLLSEKKQRTIEQRLTDLENNIVSIVSALEKLVDLHKSR